MTIWDRIDSASAELEEQLKHALLCSKRTRRRDVL